MLRLDESTLVAMARALLNDGWLSSMENVPAGSSLAVVQVMVIMPSETAFPETVEMVRADANEAAKARRAQNLNMASIFAEVLREIAGAKWGNGSGERRRWW
jgi:hypothetical protein